MYVIFQKIIWLRMIHIRKGIKKILKSGFYRVRIRIPGPESGKFETNFFLKCIVANIFRATNFFLKWSLLWVPFMKWAQCLGLDYTNFAQINTSNFSTKMVRRVDRSILWLSFAGDWRNSIFRVSELALWYGWFFSIFGKKICTMTATSYQAF